MFFGKISSPPNHALISFYIIMTTAQWTEDARVALKEIPFFVRPAARKKIERFAQEAGITEITVDVYQQAKQKFDN
jgi:hypothetical protein